MFPILLSLGPLAIYTINVMYIVSWFVFSFLFWKYLRHHGVLEERIFDLTFYSTIAAVIAARLGFVFLYPQLFSSSLLLVGAFWVQPGLWLYAGFFGMFLAFFLYSRRINIKLGQVFDAFVVALPWMLIPITLGIFFQGDELGKTTTFPWGMYYPGADGIRHPVQLYEVMVLFLIGIVSFRLMKKSFDKKWQSGLLGSLILTLLTPLLFGLEFFKVGPLYLYGISINQWLLIAIFAESCGMVCTKGGLYERLKSGIHRKDKTKADTGERSSETEDRRAQSPGSISGS
jgi:phosphatidylglycerol:prolipoprotein diacylglycerol transferase